MDYTATTKRLTFGLHGRCCSALLMPLRNNPHFSGYQCGVWRRASQTICKETKPRHGLRGTYFCFFLFLAGTRSSFALILPVFTPKKTSISGGND